MSEMFDKININAEIKKAELVEAKRRYRRKMTKRFLSRVGIAAALIGGIVAAQAFHLIDSRLARGLELAGVLWITFWLGAYVQYQLFRKGLLQR